MNGVVVGGIAGLAVLSVWYTYRRTVQVPCTIDLESTEEDFHAHVALEGVEVNEGDEVLVHNAPTKIGLGERALVTSQATVQQASLPRRVLTRVLGTSGITDLYEVGFEG